MSTTRRQHYVWKHYLRFWERDGRVSVLRKDRAEIFETNAANIAVMRDFYRIPILSEEDEAFISKFIESTSTSDLLRNLNRGWLDAIAATSRLRRTLTKFGKLDPALEKEIERVEIQSEENMLGRIESDAVRLIDALHSGHTAIWADDDDALELAYFLSLQHMRTKRIRDKMMEGFPPGEPRAAATRRWPVLRHILVTNMGWSLYSERASWRLRVLRAAGATTFITGDQPTLNLLQPDDHNGLALYYPVGPSSAALLEHHQNESPVGPGDDLTDQVVKRLNQRMFDFSPEQVFAVDSVDLRGFL